MRDHHETFRVQAACLPDGEGLLGFVEQELRNFLQCGDGQVALQLRHRWIDGTTHVAFDPVEFLGRLAVLVPRPRIDLILYHARFAMPPAFTACDFTISVSMPGPGLCRVAMLLERNPDGSRECDGCRPGIITGSPRSAAAGPRADSERV